MIIGTYSSIDRLNKLTFDDILLYENGYFSCDDFRHHKDKVINLGYVYLPQISLFDGCIANILCDKAIDNEIIKRIKDEFKNELYQDDIDVKKLVAKMKLLGLSGKQEIDICSKVNEVGLDCFYLYGNYNKRVIDRTQYEFFKTILICNKHGSGERLYSASVNSAFKRAKEDKIDDLSLAYRYPIIKETRGVLLWRFNSLTCTDFSKYLSLIVNSLSNPFKEEEEIRVYCNEQGVCGYAMSVQKGVKRVRNSIKHTRVERYFLDFAGLEERSTIHISEAKKEIKDSNYDYGLSVTNKKNIKWLEV